MSALTPNISQEIINLYHINQDDAVNISQQLDNVIDLEYLYDVDEIPMSIIDMFKGYGVDTLDLLSLYLQSGFPLEPIFSISQTNDSTVSVDANISAYISNIFDEESDSFYIYEDNENDPLFVINDDEQVRMSTILKLVSNMFNFSDIAAEALCRENYGVGSHAESFSDYNGNIIEYMLSQVPGDKHKAIIRIDGYDYGDNHINIGCDIAFDRDKNTIEWGNSLVRLIIENPGLLHVSGVILRVFNDNETAEVYSAFEKSTVTVPRKHIAAWIGHNGAYHGVSEQELGDSASIDAITEELRVPEEGVDYLSTKDIVFGDNDSF